MSAPLTTRNAELVHCRRQGDSQPTLARRFGISQPRVHQLLAQSGGDPLLMVRLADAGERELARYRVRLEERIARDLATLARVEDELEVRRIDRLAGVAD